MTFKDRFKTAPVESMPWRVGIAAVAVAGFIGCHLATPALVGEARWDLLWMAATQGIAGALLVVLAALQYRRRGGLKVLLGHSALRVLPLGASLIIALYLLATLIEAALGQTQGPLMGHALHGLSAAQIMLLFSMLLVFPAIAEELLYRHFLIGLFPLTQRTWQALAVVVTTVLFMLQGQSLHWPSYALMGALGVILGVARITSGGLAAPILLHALASFMGMCSDLLLASLD